MFAALPVQYRYEGDIFSGEKRSALLVVPALSVRVSPGVAIVPWTAPAPAPAPTPTTGARGRGAPPPKPPATGRGRGAAAAAPPPAPEPTEMREVRVTVVNDTKGADRERGGAGDCRQAGRRRLPSRQLAFAREDEAQTVRFQVRAPRTADTGEYSVSARATVGSASFDRGFQVIEYPHIRRGSTSFTSAATQLKVLDVKTTPNLTVGYIMGAGDEVPAAIEQLGARVEMPAAGRSGLGRSVAVPRDRDRRAGVREAAPISARTTAGCSTTSEAAAR